MKKLNVTPLKEDIYLLDELGGTNCYLIVGSKRALLIDCGTGFADIYGTIRDITGLPISVIATHGHVDHIGGAGAFPEIYIHKDDTAFINRIQFSRPMRMIFTNASLAAKQQGARVSDVKRAKYKTKFISIDDNFTLDLGNKEISVHHTPGHSKGSIAVIDESDRFIFSGDNVCDALWMHLPGSTSLESWLPGAQWLYDMSLNYSIYWGHRKAKLESDYILQVISWAKEIMANTKKNSLIAKIKQYPDREDGIIYRTSHVFGK